MPSYEVSVVGVTFEGRQEHLAELSKAQNAGATLIGRMVREPDNRYDPNAIKVFFLVGEADYSSGWTRFCVGYIPKALAAKLAARMDAGEKIQVAGATVIRHADADRTIFGARIQIETKEAI